MQLSGDELNEFKSECLELLEQAEASLLALDGGEPLPPHYAPIFRAFHSLKGAAGMMEQEALQAHMHRLESKLVGFAAANEVPKDYLDLFLRGVDGARQIIDGKSIQFNFELQSAPTATTASRSAPLMTPIEVAKAIALTVKVDAPIRVSGLAPAIESSGDLLAKALELLLFRFRETDRFLEAAGAAVERDLFRSSLNQLLRDARVAGISPLHSLIKMEATDGGRE